MRKTTAKIIAKYKRACRVKDCGRQYEILLLFIENNSIVLIGQELWMKSSYPFGSCPNLRHIRHYDAIWSYIENYTIL